MDRTGLTAVVVTVSLAMFIRAGLAGIREDYVRLEGAHHRSGPAAARGLGEVGASHRPPRGKAHPARGKGAFAAGQAGDGWPDQVGEAAAGAQRTGGAFTCARRLNGPPDLRGNTPGSVLHGAGVGAGTNVPDSGMDKGESGPRLDSNSLSPPS